MSLLDELAQASYAATAKFLKCDHSHWDWASETGKNQSRAEARAVVVALLEKLGQTQNAHKCYDETDCVCGHQILEDFKTLLRSAIEEGETT